jgi:dGTPase
MTGFVRDERFYEKDRPPDQRKEGQRDRDRVLYTSALRRLAAITQVVSPTEGSVFHNRLTHTLEVAQIGRRLAEYLCKDEDLMAALGGIDPERVEAAALAHDLGHPPFGHIAEKELDGLIVSRGVEDGFESNAQAFRIATKLAVRKEEFPGLNLTRATLNAVLKYPWLRENSGPKHDKWGVYSTEVQEFSWVKEPYSLKNDRSPEAELMDWADDIAYAVHDMDDFYRAGLVPIDRLAKDMEELDAFLDHAVARQRGKTRYTDSELREAGFNAIAGFPISEPYQGRRSQRSLLRTYTSTLISKYVRAIEFIENADGRLQARISSDADKEVMMLKELTWRYVIQNPALETQQYGQRRVIKDLFHIFADAAVSRGSPKNIGIFPVDYQEQLIVAGEEQERLRLISDFIASMTEQQAFVMHRRLTGIAPGSVTDIL